MGIGEEFMFYQDNNPKHKARIAQEFLLYNCSKVLEFPPQSPDLNSIEYGMNSIRIRKKTINTRNELKHRLTEK